MARGGLDHLQGLVEPLSADDEIVIALGASVVGASLGAFVGGT